ncbi:MAG: dihydroxyacetone kinase subunit L [Candidatus Hydrogenedentes bacterium]|nr:dihydroxyacetone kinase subunit L [Candidatus Hydrogenedentota bacterium]
MMISTIGYEEMVRMLRGAVSQIRDNHEMLSKLDSVGGDGDHGTTMLRAMTHLEQAVDSCASHDVKTLLNDVGWAIMGVDGGATGPLLGTFFMSTGEGLSDSASLDAPALLAAFAAGLAGVQAQTKAKVGDKTMIDALVPAVEALRAAVEAGSGVTDALRAAADGAAQGAASTKEMQARFGRAKNIKEQSIGTQDPGATSVSLIFRGFLKGVESNA